MQTVADSSGACARGLAATAWRSPSHRLQDPLRIARSRWRLIHCTWSCVATATIARRPMWMAPDRLRIGRTTNQETGANNFRLIPANAKLCVWTKRLSGMLSESTNQL